MRNSFIPIEIWPDDHGVHINAHGGGILQHDGRYYWYGEHKIAGTAGNVAQVGVHVYVSEDLYNWRDGGIALDIRDGRVPELPVGCILERPKVLRARSSGQFVMFFHFESDKRYDDAAIGFAVADNPLGPFSFHHIQRPVPGHWPLNTPPELKDPESIRQAEEIYAQGGQAIRAHANEANLLGACIQRGQESRDMTAFVDDDGKAYHVYSSEMNSTTHIAELTDDLLGYTGRFCRIFVKRYMEAPCIFKRTGKYYFIGSGCTGWAPNAARSAVADSLFGPWQELGNPACDEDGEYTYHSQSTFVLPLPNDQYIFMADRWMPKNAIDGRYLWLPIEFDCERPLIRRPAEWRLK
jgi:hypothetical protein